MERKGNGRERRRPPDSRNSSAARSDVMDVIFYGDANPKSRRKRRRAEEGEEMGLFFDRCPLRESAALDWRRAVPSEQEKWGQGPP